MKAVGGNDPAILYCAICGEACTRTEALLRKFNTGFSGCCNDNLLAKPPLEPMFPKKQIPTALRVRLGQTTKEAL